MVATDAAADALLTELGARSRIRTGVTDFKGRRPGPLDDPRSVPTAGLEPAPAPFVAACSSS